MPKGYPCRHFRNKKHPFLEFQTTNLTKMTENLAKILCGKITNLQGNVRHNEEEPTSVYHYRKVGISSTLFKLIQY